jgi:hypothetical protein
MNSEQQKQMRDEFECCAKTDIERYDLPDGNDQFGYRNFTTQKLWVGFQAAGV